MLFSHASSPVLVINYAEVQVVIQSFEVYFLNQEHLAILSFIHSVLNVNVFSGCCVC